MCACLAADGLNTPNGSIATWIRELHANDSIHAILNCVHSLYTCYDELCRLNVICPVFCGEICQWNMADARTMHQQYQYIMRNCVERTQVFRPENISQNRWNVTRFVDSVHAMVICWWYRSSLERVFQLKKGGENVVACTMEAQVSRYFLSIFE